MVRLEGRADLPKCRIRGEEVDRKITGSQDP